MAFNFVDLFCGIGGFHQGVKRTIKDAECIFAADNDIQVAEVYKNSYGIDAFKDLSTISTQDELQRIVEEKSSIDLLCAGFPCQSFSKAGKQLGFKDETKGTLFFEIKKILNIHKPKYFILENVRNLEKHDGGNTKKVILKNLTLDYFVDTVILGPNHLGIPALRDRIFILGVRKDLLKEKFSLEKYIHKVQYEPSIYVNGVLDPKYFNPNEKNYNVPKTVLQIIDMWEDLRRRIHSENKKIVSPLWLKYFDLNFKFSDEPKWKRNIIARNISFYKENKVIVDDWMSKNKKLLDNIIESNKKFEWNANKSIDNIHKGIIQFRPSGVRVKKPTTIPTLVAINHRPILNKRYLSPTVLAKLYGFDMNILKLDEHNDSKSYKQLGNTVSVDVIAYLVDILVNKVGTNEKTID